MLEIINSLLSHLRQSVTADRSAGTHKSQNDERQYQEALINALGEFANNLPGKVPLLVVIRAVWKICCCVGDRF